MGMIFNITPVPKPRMTQRDKWAKRPPVMRYRAFCAEIILKAGNFQLPDAYKVRFVMPMPKTWSAAKKQEMLGKPHQQTPDLDNLVKALNDAFLKEDKTIHHIDAEKYWGFFPCIIIDPMA